MLFDKVDKETRSRYFVRSISFLKGQFFSFINFQLKIKRKAKKEGKNRDSIYLVVYTV